MSRLISKYENVTEMYRAYNLFWKPTTHKFPINLVFAIYFRLPAAKDILQNGYRVRISVKSYLLPRIHNVKVEL